MPNKTPALNFFSKKNIYKVSLALLFLGSGKNDLQNQPRSLIFGLGKK